MKLQCPHCAKEVPAAHISLDAGWGKCAACQELFPLTEVVPGFPAPGLHSGELIPRPFNARAIIGRTAAELLVYVPPEGMRAATWGLLGFATFWLGFIAFWTIGALGCFGSEPSGPANWAFACFSIPFWLVGVAMLGGVAWMGWGTQSVRIDLEQMTTYRHCLVWSRSVGGRAGSGPARPALRSPPGRLGATSAQGRDRVWGWFLRPARGQRGRETLAHRRDQ